MCQFTYTDILELILCCKQFTICIILFDLLVFCLVELSTVLWWIKMNILILCTSYSDTAMSNRPFVWYSVLQQLLPSQGASSASYQMQAAAAAAAMEGQYHRLAASAVNAGSAGVSAAPQTALLVTAPSSTSSELMHGGAIQLKDLAHHGGVSTSTNTSTVNSSTTSSEQQTVGL